MNHRIIAHQVFRAAFALRREGKSFEEIKNILGLKSREWARRAVAAGNRLESAKPMVAVFSYNPATSSACVSAADVGRTG